MSAHELPKQPVGAFLHFGGGMAGARHSRKDQELVKRVKADATRIVEAAVELGADAEETTEMNETKAVSLLEQYDQVLTAFEQQFRPARDFYDDYAPMARYPWVIEVYEGYVIVKLNQDYWRVDYTMGAEGVTFASREAWQKVEKEWAPKSAVAGLRSDMVVARGGALKALGDGKIGGYLVTFSTSNDPDLTGDFFTRETDFGIEDGAKTAVYFNHRLPLKTRDGSEVVIKEKIGEGTLKIVDKGVLIDAILYNREQYEEALAAMGWSSGTAGHLVEAEQIGKSWWIKAWPLGLDASVTPTPAEPRNSVLPLKALSGTPLSDSSRGGAATKQEAIVSEIQGAAPTVVSGSGPDIEAIVARAVEAATTKAVEALMAKLEAEPAVKGGYAVPAVHTRRETDLTPDMAFKMWLKWGPEAPPAVTRFMRRQYTKITGLDMAGDTLKATLAEGTDAQGGYWVPTVHADEIIVPLANSSYLRRAGATIMRDMRGTDSFKIPSLTFAAAAVIGGEGSAYTASEPTAGEVEFNPYKLKRLALATEEMVEDSRYDVWSMILQPDFEQSFSEGENTYFTTGTGSGQPQGVVAGATVGVTAASATAITADEVINLYHSVDYKYREDPTCAWMMNDSTLQYLSKLKTGAGDYLMQQALNGQPDSIKGKPIITNNSMAAIATGNRTILFGAFRYYRIADWPGLQIQRLNEKYADTGHIGFRAFRRVDANIMLAAAFRVLIQA